MQFQVVEVVLPRCVIPAGFLALSDGRIALDVASFAVGVNLVLSPASRILNRIRIVKVPSIPPPISDAAVGLALCQINVYTFLTIGIR